MALAWTLHPCSALPSMHQGRRTRGNSGSSKFQGFDSQFSNLLSLNMATLGTKSYCYSATKVSNVLPKTPSYTPARTFAMQIPQISKSSLLTELSSHCRSSSQVQSSYLVKIRDQVTQKLRTTYQPSGIYLRTIRGIFFSLNSFIAI